MTDTMRRGRRMKLWNALAALVVLGMPANGRTAGGTPLNPRQWQRWRQ